MDLSTSIEDIQESIPHEIIISVNNLPDCNPHSPHIWNDIDRDVGQNSPTYDNPEGSISENMYVSDYFEKRPTSCDLKEPIGEKRPRSDSFEGCIDEKRSKLNNVKSDEKRLKEVANFEGDNIKFPKRLDPSLSIRRVAEIVLVLSAIGKIRGAKLPSQVEKEMMAEARSKVAEIWGQMAPSDVIHRDAIGAVMEDLGFSKPKDNQRLGFWPPPKMSISEKMLLTKKKMDELKMFAHSSSQRPQTTFSGVTENHGTSNIVRMFPSDKPNHASFSSGSIQPSSSFAQASSAISTPPPSNGLRSRSLSSGLHTIPSSVKNERSHFKLDGGLNGTSYTSQIRVNTPHAKTPMWSLQSQSSTMAKSGLENKVPQDHTAAMSRLDSQTLREQAIKSSGSMPHQPLQNTNYVQAPSVLNGHIEISKIVQKSLQPKIPQHPTWTPPSRDYMNKGLTCQICNISINDVESALVCDACEKGFHLKCVPSPNQKGIPRGEWHCSRCLALSNGKPIPPKYGRVMRNMTAPKFAPSEGQSSSEKKVDMLDEKANQQKIAASGYSGVRDSLIDVNIPNEREMQDRILVSNRQEVDDKPDSESCINKSTSPSVSDMPSGGETNDRSTSYVQISDSSVSEQRSGFESKLRPFLKSSGTPINIVGYSESHCKSDFESKLKPSVELNDVSINRVEYFEVPCNPDIESKLQPPVKQFGVPINIVEHSDAACESQHVEQKCLLVEVLLNQDHNSKAVVTDPDKFHGRETLDCDESNSENSLKESDFGTIDHVSIQEDQLNGVDWIGNIVKVVDDMTFYQSCSINGVTFKLQDHALFHSSNDRLIPCKLQDMWEDRKTRRKWITAGQYYFPSDLSQDIEQSPYGNNEVLESNIDSTIIMAGLIQGPCEVLPQNKYQEELERRSHLGIEATVRLHPIFQCRWMYDKSKSIFKLVSS